MSFVQPKRLHRRPSLFAHNLRVSFKPPALLPFEEDRNVEFEMNEPRPLADRGSKRKNLGVGELLF
jgi:hypothetical protein